MCQIWKNSDHAKGVEMEMLRLNLPDDTMQSNKVKWWNKVKEFFLSKEVRSFKSWTTSEWNSSSSPNNVQCVHKIPLIPPHHTHTHPRSPPNNVPLPASTILHVMMWKQTYLSSLELAGCQRYKLRARTQTHTHPHTPLRPFSNFTR